MIQYVIKVFFQLKVVSSLLKALFQKVELRDDKILKLENRIELLQKYLEEEQKELDEE